MEALFDNIRAECARKHWSIARFCIMLDIDRKRFYGWQQRKDLPTSYLVKMAKLFGTTTDELLGL